MPNTREIFEHLASILSYPEGRIAGRVARLCELAPRYGQMLQPFVDYLESAGTKEVEELFTSTFDLNPSCCLEVGWHLYGEDYRRGIFLVDMRRTLAEERLPESIELPDHLSHCLRLFPRLEPDEARAFAEKYLLPAVGKILDAMEEDNPYTCVIGMLQKMLQDRYGPGRPDSGTGDSTFIELPVFGDVLRYENAEDPIPDFRSSPSSRRRYE